MTIPIELIDDFQAGEVVAFCGAGLSVASGLPTGGAVARDLAALLPDFDGDPQNLTEVATVYEATRGRNALIRHLVRAGSRAAVPNGAHHALAQLPLAGVVTTNWDRLIEDSLSVSSRAHSVIVHDTEAVFTHAGDISVLKLHGSVERPDSIIVTERDYHRVFLRSAVQVEILSYYFATRTILFLGYSLADSDLRRLLYLTGERLGPLRRRAYAVQVSPRRSQSDFWRSEQVEIIDAEAEQFLLEMTTHAE